MKIFFLLIGSLFVVKAATASDLASLLKSPFPAFSFVERPSVSPLLLMAHNDLEFGDVRQGDPGAIVSVGDPGDASWMVSGDSNATVEIVVSNSVSLSGPGPNIAVKEMKYVNTIVLDFTGEAYFGVGAVLEALPVDQNLGYYTGSYYVTAHYSAPNSEELSANEMGNIVVNVVP